MNKGQTDAVASLKRDKLGLIHVTKVYRGAEV
jgi:hypothetical protein